jgi:hypothetical protein
VHLCQQNTGYDRFAVHYPVYFFGGGVVGNYIVTGKIINISNYMDEIIYPN